MAEAKKDARLTQTAWMAPGSRQGQLVSGVRARATSPWLPRELAVESLRPFRRFLEDATGLQLSGKRSALSGAYAQGDVLRNGAFASQASEERASGALPR